MGQNKRIGTHSGTFHCDEALGCFLLQQTLKFRDSDIIRTRDPSVLQELDVVIDVGGEYDPCMLFEMQFMSNGPCHIDGLNAIF